MATIITNLSLFDGFDGLFNDSDYDAEEYCCEGGDVCNMEESMNFEVVFIPILYSLAFVIGVLGNAVLLGVLVQTKRSWSVTDTFILHLGVADVMLLVTLPLWAAQTSLEAGWTFSVPLCQITGVVFTINFYCGIFLLACISLDRYLSIVHATQMYSRRKSWVVHASCLGVWLLSVLLSVPDWMFLDVVQDERRGIKNECVRNYYKFGREAVHKWRLASRLLYHIVGFLIPSAMLIFCYSCILRQLRCGSQGLQKQKAFRVIVAVVVVFFICWTPYNITLLADTLQSDYNDTCGARTSLEKAKIVTSTLGYLHCSLNPVLYAFVGVKFRRQLLDILRSLGCKMKICATFQSAVSSRRSSLWSESGDTSRSIAI